MLYVSYDTEDNKKILPTGTSKKDGYRCLHGSGSETPSVLLVTSTCRSDNAMVRQLLVIVLAKNIYGKAGNFGRKF